MGKGCKYRPCDYNKFNENFDTIFGKKDFLDYHKDKEEVKEKDGTEDANV